jgi:hypothetical protein
VQTLRGGGGVELADENFATCYVLRRPQKSE